MVAVKKRQVPVAFSAENAENRATITEMARENCVRVTLKGQTVNGHETPANVNGPITSAKANGPAVLAPQG